jgi:hypothetical protein
MQYRLVLSPKSIPIVTDFCARLVFTVRFWTCWQLLRFFMAGLLCTSSAYRELTASRIEPAFSIPFREEYLTGEGALGANIGVSRHRGIT